MSNDRRIRRTLKYFLNIDSLTSSVCEQSEFPELAPN